MSQQDGSLEHQKHMLLGKKMLVKWILWIYDGDLSRENHLIGSGADVIHIVN